MKTLTIIFAGFVLTTFIGIKLVDYQIEQKERLLTILCGEQREDLRTKRTIGESGDSIVFCNNEDEPYNATHTAYLKRMK